MKTKGRLLYEKVVEINEGGFMYGGAWWIVTLERLYLRTRTVPNDIFGEYTRRETYTATEREYVNVVRESDLEKYRKRMEADLTAPAD